MAVYRMSLLYCNSHLCCYSCVARSKGSNVFSCVCLCVYLSVNTITPELLEILS